MKPASQGAGFFVKYECCLMIGKPGNMMLPLLFNRYRGAIADARPMSAG